MPFWSRKQEHVDPLIGVVAEWSSDVLLIGWTHGHHEEGMARISLGLAPREETEQKPNPELWIPQALRLLGQSIGELSGWQYDEESRALRKEPESEDFFPEHAPIMVETFKSLAELVSAVSVLAVFARGKALGFSDKQIQKVWDRVAQGVEGYWQTEHADKYELLNEEV